MLGPQTYRLVFRQQVVNLIEKKNRRAIGQTLADTIRGFLLLPFIPGLEQLICCVCQGKTRQVSFFSSSFSLDMYLEFLGDGQYFLLFNTGMNKERKGNVVCILPV